MTGRGLYGLNISTTTINVVFLALKLETILREERYPMVIPDIWIKRVNPELRI
jgi:hypothetical protein